jgi:hypothetical protein
MRRGRVPDPGGGVGGALSGEATAEKRSRRAVAAGLVRLEGIPLAHMFRHHSWYAFWHRFQHTTESESNVTDAEKIRENRMRRMAERQGLRLSKSRRRDPRAIDYDRWQVFAGDDLVRGNLTPEQVEEGLLNGEWIREEAS